MCKDYKKSVERTAGCLKSSESNECIISCLSCVSWHRLLKWVMDCRLISEQQPAPPLRKGNMSCFGGLHVLLHVLHVLLHVLHVIHVCSMYVCS